VLARGVICYLSCFQGDLVKEIKICFAKQLSPWALP
jgi:hypothetical protein